MSNINGILIQGLNEKNNIIKNFKYEGINAYHQFPLSSYIDSECMRLTREQCSREIENDLFISLEFISSRSLYERYLTKCVQMELPVRALLVESDYDTEIWEGTLPPVRLLGYEYCPIPIDNQIVTDMDWYKPFAEYRSKLNEYGLFCTYEDIADFVNDYKKAMDADEIGDGEIDAFICRVSQVII